MKHLFITINFSLLLLTFLSGCASKPRLYPNSHFKQVGKEKANEDIKYCMKESDEYLESSKGKKIAKGAGAGAIIGGAMGAVGGIFTGNIGRGALVGGAIGGAGGAAAGSLSPDEIKHRYVNTCLSEKGYKVLGWD
ncbi:MAG: cell envelope biogenesis protein OmpA [Bacteriovoracaceae bacterium]